MSMLQSLYRHKIILIVIAVLIGWAVLFHFVPPAEIINTIGINNTYLAAFILSIVGGFSSVTGTSVYVALIGLTKGGADPLWLGLISGVGLFISDSLFYYIISKWREYIKKIIKKWEEIFTKLQYYIRVLPDWLVYAIVFSYIAFAPIPNDILLAVLAVSGYHYRQLFVFILAGDITMALLLTFFVA